MRRALAAVLVLLCVLHPTRLYAGGGKLRQVREEVRQDKKPDPRQQEAADANDDDDADWSFGDDGDSIIIEGLWGTLATSCWLLGTSIYVLPANCLGDHYGTEFGFGRFPYADDSVGLMCNLAPPTARLGTPQPADDIEPTEWRVEMPPLPQQPGRAWSGRVFVEESNDFDGLNRVNGQVLIESCSRFGFQAGWSYLREELDCGCHDELWLGDATVTFLFAQSDRVQLRTGLGCRWLTDGSDSNFGVNFLYGGDFYPAKPLVISTAIELGNLGSAFVIHGRATAGIIWSRFELFGGYDWLRIGEVNLHGPVLGVRLWF